MLLLAAPSPRLLLCAPKPTAGLLPRRATMRIFSFGGGVQSHAVLALQALGKLRNPYDAFVFSNVGADSENPATLDYIERYTKPFCALHGIRFVEVQKTKGRGANKTTDTLKDKFDRSQKSIVIPARMGHNGAPGNRTCTEDFKVAVVDKWVKTQAPQWVVMGLGISIDEFRRVKDTAWHDRIETETGGRAPFGFWKRREYPLVDLLLTRRNCFEVIERVGLPQPPKSSCFFCPFKKRNEWIETKKEHPELFEIAVGMEHDMNRKRVALGRVAAYLHPDCVPLEYAVGDQPALFPVEVMDQCDSGFCWT